MIYHSVFVPTFTSELWIVTERMSFFALVCKIDFYVVGRQTLTIFFNTVVDIYIYIFDC